ncbi:uncharacterized protein N7473_002682 [Penicillium subrubescens]|uniref:Uncharacterized protein n=1 Tax=Penicillium subrubescens TaxID=1316194 RepID=A0A1Q5UKS0_9EURO|nr:uncharacterized protein N7473_002682 [Penicillium subrubescens]KAJ5905766.1 hypothetical protein N7473_002682 [Penicillium subrubescens]OKP13085.1 hypothetical protein PENSUB_1185 [Penicillium subrubescens]
MPPSSIPPFLLPRGLPTARTLRTLQQTQHHASSNGLTTRRCFSETRTVAARPKRVTDKSRILSQPDKFRPPSHPQRLVNPARTAPSGQPVNYGRALSAEERAEQDKKQYPNMFPPEGTVMFKFLTSRWIHIWIAMGTLTTLATFTFTTNFKATSPFAHLLPSWSDLLTHPIGTCSQAMHVYRMHVQHESMRVREQRHRRVEDAEKRRQYRIAHGLEDAPEKEGSVVSVEGGDDGQSPVATDVAVAAAGDAAGEEFVDWEGKKKPVKKWLGIW